MLPSYAFIIHGCCGHPGENWFPWLKEKLEEKGIETIVPAFPTPEGNLSDWLNGFKPYEEKLPNSIIIAHSLGVPFSLRLLERNKALAAFLVAGFASPLNNKFDSLIKTFVEKPFSWEKIRKNCPHFVLFHSPNDPYVDVSKAYELKENLNATLILIPNAGHFNEAAGYTTFPMLMEEIEKLL